MSIQKFTAEKVGADTVAFYFSADIAERRSVTNQVLYDRDGVLIVLDQFAGQPCGVEVVLQQNADYEALVRAYAPSALVDEMLDLIRTGSVALNTFKLITAEDGRTYMFKYAHFDQWRALPPDQKCSQVLSHELVDGMRIEGTWVRVCPIGDDVAAIEIIVDPRAELEPDLIRLLHAVIPDDDIDQIWAIITSQGLSEYRQ